MLPFLVAYTLVLVLCCKVASIPFPSYSWVARELWQCSVHWLDDRILILCQWDSLDPNIRWVVDTTLSSSPFSFTWQAVAALGPQLWKHWRQQTARCTLSVSVASTILTLIRWLSPNFWCLCDGCQCLWFFGCDWQRADDRSRDHWNLSVTCCERAWLNIVFLKQAKVIPVFQLWAVSFEGVSNSCLQAYRWRHCGFCPGGFVTLKGEFDAIFSNSCCFDL